MSNLTKNMPDRLPVPYTSPQARTYAAEDLYRGEQSLFHPDDFRKDDASCELSDLLFEVGRASGRERNELLDAHSAIPDHMAPSKEGTLGVKTPLAERIRVLLAKIEAYEQALNAVVDCEAARRHGGPDAADLQSLDAALGNAVAIAAAALEAQ